ncbi:ATP-binding protein [Luteimonas sp. MC1750]|uniref:ATP-binding protein n=1 Tax=Luteimonas sp. MC1750 TaxID=2799326 RepID=UPI0018F08CA8|nr:ATP-binding protein [Luteimonas sp. MC1750]MBJ6984036.1 ATP-binding protein [Luteimonas sp. MC1750]QQO06848.1 ATP-binding protein [Luteimonas sp. MC1750]
MRLPTIYDSLNILPSLGERVISLIRRRPFNPADTDTRKGVYQRANERYDHLVLGGDLINIAPVLEGQPLFNVEAGDETTLTQMGALNVGGKWLMPKVDEDERWNFKKWFPRATPDLESTIRDWRLTADGKPTNGYIIPEDLGDGSDSTATALVMGAFPILFALGYFLSQFPGGMWLAGAICLPLLMLHMITLYQSEDTATVVKLLALSWGVPILMGGIGPVGTGEIANLTSGGMKSAAIGAVLLVALTMTLKTGSEDAPLVSFFGRLWLAIKVLVAVLAINFGLGMLPESLDFFRPIGLLVMSCAYPLLYTLENYNARTIELERLSKQQAGAMSEDDSALGKLSPARMTQIAFAARDKSPFLPLGWAKGVMAKYDMASAPDMWQVMGLTLKDLSTHLHIFGATGSGKTSSVIRPILLWLATLKEKVGVILSDGKGALVAEMRPLLDIVIEPETKFAPFQGLGAEEITTAFAESRNDDLNSDSIWSQGAGTFHRFALALLEAAVAHEKAAIARAGKRLEQYEHQVVYYLAKKLKNEKLGLPTDLEDRAISGLTKAIDGELRAYKAKRKYRWTPACYADMKDMISVPVMGAGGVFKANRQTMALLRWLGWFGDIAGIDIADANEQQAALIKEMELRLELDPESIHPDFRLQGRVLSRAAGYFTNKWPNTDEKQRSSFLINVDEDILGFLKSDKLRGHLLDDGVVGEDEAWADTEEGVDITRVVYGARLGINLPYTQYGDFGKLITKLVKTRIFREIKLRTETHGGLWKENTGQSVVIDMTDECQELVSNMEVDLTAVGRSMGLYFIYATQMIESLDKILKSQDAKTRYLENFRSQITFVSSKATYKMFQNRAGEVKKLQLPVSVQSTIDISRGLDTRHNTIYFDPKHPSAHALRDLRRRGSTRLQVIARGLKGYMGLSRKIKLDDLDHQNYIAINSGGSYVQAPVIEDTDLTTHLAEKGHALFFLNRADHTRLDFVRTKNIEAEDVEKMLAEGSNQNTGGTK